ncbi:MAG: LacI family transcriptional regulator, partial [Streptomyces sp.]|nr:LacI family transcriptional regulator [Streptomyces sp.]
LLLAQLDDPDAGPAAPVEMPIRFVLRETTAPPHSQRQR